MPYFKDLSVCAYHSTGLKQTFCLSNVNMELSADEQMHKITHDGRGVTGSHTRIEKLALQISTASNHEY